MYVNVNVAHYRYHYILFWVRQASAIYFDWLPMYQYSNEATLIRADASTNLRRVHEVLFCSSWHATNNSRKKVLAWGCAIESAHFTPILAGRLPRHPHPLPHPHLRLAADLLSPHALPNPHVPPSLHVAPRPHVIPSNSLKRWAGVAARPRLGLLRLLNGPLRSVLRCVWRRKIAVASRLRAARSGVCARCTLGKLKRARRGTTCAFPGKVSIGEVERCLADSIAQNSLLVYYLFPIWVYLFRIWVLKQLRKFVWIVERGYMILAVTKLISAMQLRVVVDILYGRCNCTLEIVSTRI